jgi:hypothetical protein
MASLGKWHDRVLRLLMSPDQRRRLVPIHMQWKARDYFAGAQARWGGITGIPDQRCFFLQSALRSLDAVPGEVAECGVRYGKSTMFLAEIVAGRREMHLFDSFEGLSEADPAKDPGVNIWKAGGRGRRFRNRRLDEVLARFARHPNITVHQGWIPDRFAEVADRRFAFVHVDVDMYQPTLDSVRFFYDRLVPGGMLVCDDYGSGKFPGAKTAVDEALEGRPEIAVELPTGQAFFVRRG